jgi:hypothetical protein
MPQATGLAPVRGYMVDRDAVLFGPVRVGDGQVAGTRDGSARILSDSLNLADTFKVVANGGAANAAGGYFIEVAHVARGAAIGTANPAAYVRIGSISFNGTTPMEFAISGATIDAQVRAAASPAIVGDVRIVALRLVAGTGVGANGLAAPVNTSAASIHYQPF